MVYCAGLEIRFRHFRLIWNDLDTLGLSFLRIIFSERRTWTHLDLIGLNFLRRVTCRGYLQKRHTPLFQISEKYFLHGRGWSPFTCLENR